MEKQICGPLAPAAPIGSGSPEPDFREMKILSNMLHKIVGFFSGLSLKNWLLLGIEARSRGLQSPLLHAPRIHHSLVDLPARLIDPRAKGLVRGEFPRCVQYIRCLRQEELFQRGAIRDGGG